MCTLRLNLAGFVGRIKMHSIDCRARSFVLVKEELRQRWRVKVISSVEHTHTHPDRLGFLYSLLVAQRLEKVWRVVVGSTTGNNRFPSRSLQLVPLHQTDPIGLFFKNSTHPTLSVSPLCNLPVAAFFPLRYRYGMIRARGGVPVLFRKDGRVHTQMSVRHQQ